MNADVSLEAARLKPLVRAAVQNGNAALISDYLSRGGHVDARDQHGWTPLMIAASRGHAALCRVLLDRGADGEAKNQNGKSACDIADAEGHQEVVRLLRPVEFGASEFVDKDGDAPSELVGSWLPEDEVEAPAVDHTCRVLALQFHQDYAAYTPEDTGEDWSDLVVDLPEVEGLAVDREFEHSGFREKLSRLIGQVGEYGIYNLALVDKALQELADPRDEDATRHVLQLLDDLGMVHDEDQEIADGGYAFDSDLRTDDQLEECLQYLKDLRSRTNDPYFHVVEDVRRSVLLDRESEERIGRRIGLALKDACIALSTDEGASSALIIMEQEVQRDPTRAGLFSRIDGGSPQGSDATDDDSEEQDASRPNSRFGDFLRAAIAECEAGHGSNGSAVLDSIERLQLTTSGVRTLLSAMQGSRHYNQFLTKAVERVSKLEYEMFAANVRLAISVAEKYRWSRLPQMDRIQETYLGLLKAIERFDFERGFKFSTYATWWLRQSVTRSIADKERLIRLPVHVVDRIRKLDKISRQAGSDSPLEIPISYLASSSGYSEVEVQKTLSIVADPVLWDDSDEDLNRVAAFVDETSDPFDQVQKAEIQRIVAQAVDRLDFRDAEVIRHRFGLVDSEEKTLEEVGVLFGVTRERIRQIEAKALGKLRKASSPIACLEDYVPGYR